MENLIKKLTYAGLGLLAISQQKAKELGQEIADKTNMSEEEGRKFVEDLSAESDKVRNELNESVKETVEKTIKKLDIPTKKEVQALESRISKLEEQLKEKDQGKAQNQ